MPESGPNSVEEIELTEEQKEAPGINDWVEMKAFAEEQTRQAEKRGRERVRR